MIVNPEVGDVFRSRAKVLSTIRRYLEDRGFLDIETPVLQVKAADVAPLRMVVKPLLPNVQLSLCGRRQSPVVLLGIRVHEAISSVTTSCRRLAC
jgi:hypothetical protein